MQLHFISYNSNLGLILHTGHIFLSKTSANFFISSTLETAFALLIFQYQV